MPSRTSFLLIAVLLLACCAAGSPGGTSTARAATKAAKRCAAAPAAGRNARPAAKRHRVGASKRARAREAAARRRRAARRRAARKRQARCPVVAPAPAVVTPPDVPAAAPATPTAAFPAPVPSTSPAQEQEQEQEPALDVEPGPDDDPDPTPTCTTDCDAGRLLFSTTYDASADRALVPATNPVAGTWYRAQVPNHGDATNGTKEWNRLAVEPAPGLATDPNRPASDTLRFELRPYDDASVDGTRDGDVTDTGGYLANRNEVYDRIDKRGTPAARWPDPIGSTRWYSFAVYIPEDFTLGPNTRWLDLTQWKGLNTGGPPVALEIAGDRFKLGGHNVSEKFARVTPGRWYRFVFGMKFATTKEDGWVTVQMNGKELISQLPVATMNTYTKDGQTLPDPNYFKQGIYRDRDWTVTHRVWFGPLKLGTTAESVA